MQKLIVAAACLLLVAGGAVAQNLFTNGDFEQGLEVGWTQDVRTAAGSYRFEVSDTFGQPVPGQAAKAYKYLAYHAALVQTVDVPNANLSLDFDGRLIITGGSSTCWPVATIIVSYLDAADAGLGRTLFIVKDQYCNWVESDSVHFYEEQNTGAWKDFHLDIAQELEDHLPAVSAGNVRKIKIELFAYDNGT